MATITLLNVTAIAVENDRIALLHQSPNGGIFAGPLVWASLIRDQVITNWREAKVGPDEGMAATVDISINSGKIIVANMYLDDEMGALVIEYPPGVDIRLPLGRATIETLPQDLLNLMSEPGDWF